MIRSLAGAGLILPGMSLVNGASAAHHLAADGYRVLLVDRKDFVSGASSRSGRICTVVTRFTISNRTACQTCMR